MSKFESLAYSVGVCAMINAAGFSIALIIFDLVS